MTIDMGKEWAAYSKGIALNERKPADIPAALSDQVRRSIEVSCDKIGANKSEMGLRL